MSRLLYLYGFVPGEGPTPPRDLAGVGEGGVRRLPLDGFAAVVGDVPGAQFSPEAVESRLRDLAWVGDQGALHEQVVTWFVDHGGILPSRLLTLFSGEEALRSSLDGEGGRIRATLERLAGLREWDLKVSYRAEALRRGLGAISEPVAALDREIEAADPGRRYLLVRKREKLVESETGRAARALGDRVLEALRPLARTVRLLPAPRDEAELPVVAHAALLVEESAEDELAARARDLRTRLEERGVTVGLTGPWAPYRFMSQEEEGPGGE